MDPLYSPRPPLKMQGDPWTRKKTVMVLAITDIALAIFLICYAGYRLLKYDYMDQSLIVLISSHEYIVVSVLYWLMAFAILSVQLVFAFLLLTATKDMTIDPDTMIKKCEWWRTTSFVFFILLFIDIFILVYEFYMNDGRLKTMRLVMASLELLFRAYGVFFVGKFIRDLHTLFGAPMVQYANTNQSIPSSPVPSPRCPVASQRGIV